MLGFKTESRAMFEQIHNDLSYLSGVSAVAFSGGEIKPLLGTYENKDVIKNERVEVDGVEWMRVD